MLNMDAVNPDYPIPDWLYDGQVAYTSFDLKKVIKGKIIVAAGDAGRFVSDDGEYDKWVDRYRLRIKRII